MVSRTHWIPKLLASLEPPRARKLARRMVSLQHAQLYRRGRVDTPQSVALVKAWLRVDRCLGRQVLRMLGGAR